MVAVVALLSMASTRKHLKVRDKLRPAVYVYLTEQERELIRARAKADDRSIASWCRRTLLAALEPGAHA